MHSPRGGGHLGEEALPAGAGVLGPDLDAGVTSGFGRLTLRAVKPHPEGYPVRPTTLGEHVLRRRLDLGLMVMEVGPRIGVNPKTITTWEHGTAEPALDLHPAIHAFLGYCPVERLQAGLGERLLTWRRAHGLSREKLAARLGLDRTTLWRFEKGHTGVPTRKVRSVVSALLANG